MEGQQERLAAELDGHSWLGQLAHMRLTGLETLVEQTGASVADHHHQLAHHTTQLTVHSKQLAEVWVHLQQQHQQRRGPQWPQGVLAGAGGAVRAASPVAAGQGSGLAGGQRRTKRRLDEPALAPAPAVAGALSAPMMLQLQQSEAVVIAAASEAESDIEQMDRDAQASAW